MHRYLRKKYSFLFLNFVLKRKERLKSFETFYLEQTKYYDILYLEITFLLRFSCLTKELKIQLLFFYVRKEVNEIKYFYILFGTRKIILSSPFHFIFHISLCIFLESRNLKIFWYIYFIFNKRK